MTLKKNKEVHLTNSEEDLMGIFWEKGEPLTSVDIMELSEDRSWNGNYIHMMLRSLLKKGMLEVCGTVQYGAQYARQFIPSITKEQYAAKLIMSKGIGKGSIADVAVAMVNASGELGGDELIRQLEDIVKELKQKTGDQSAI